MIVGCHANYLFAVALQEPPVADRLRGTIPAMNSSWQIGCHANYLFAVAMQEAIMNERP